MSEFRIFCIGGFVLAGLLAALTNHLADGNPPPGSLEAIFSVLAFVVFGGCASVALFGGRK